MDVVRKNIESLRGQVEIRSEPGTGSVFKMSLPLTLAIIDGMVVRVGQETYVIPTVSIVRSVKPAPGDVSRVQQKGEMLLTQGRLIPLIRLAGLYSINDEQQEVIKTLGEAIKDIPGISGGAILPNGRVGLILDVGGLLRLADMRYGQNEKKMTDVCEDPMIAA